MKTPKIIAAVVALSMGLSNVAIAHSGPHGGRGDGSQAEQRDDHRGGDRAQERRDDRRADRRDDRRDWRRDARRDSRQDVRVADRRHDPRQGERWDRRDPRWAGHGHRDARPRHDIYRGGRLPPSYRSHLYVVDDWRGHRLHRPPPGYHWVQAGGDYVLAAIATGVILSILLSH